LRDAWNAFDSPSDSRAIATLLAFVRLFTVRHFLVTAWSMAAGDAATLVIPRLKWFAKHGFYAGRGARRWNVRRLQGQSLGRVPAAANPIRLPVCAGVDIWIRSFFRGNFNVVSLR